MKEIYLILDNIRSAQNVGTIIRTAEAAGINKIFIAGITPTPKDKKVLKTSLGAEKWIEIIYKTNTFTLLNELKRKGIKVISLEINKKAVSLYKQKYDFPLCLIVGNETSGISPEILNLSDSIIKIPMRGKKSSLNVSNATAIALYEITKYKV